MPRSLLDGHTYLNLSRKYIESVHLGLEYINKSCLSSCYSYFSNTNDNKKIYLSMYIVQNINSTF